MDRRDGASGGGTHRQRIKLTGETLFGPAEKNPTGREAHKGSPRKRGNEAGQGVGGGRSTDEARDNRADVNEDYLHVVDVDLKSYFDTIDHELLVELVERRVGDVQIIRLIRAWFAPAPSAVYLV